MAGQKHFIQSQQLEIYMSDTEDMNDLLLTIGKRYQENILPRLDHLFDSMTSPDESIQIDHLKIDAGTVSIDAWEQELVLVIAKRVQQSIDLIRGAHREDFDTANPTYSRGNVEEERGLVMSKDEANIGAFIFFLQHGYLKSGHLEPSSEEAVDRRVGEMGPAVIHDILELHILSILERNPLLAGTIRAAISESASMLRRLVRQFSDVFCEALEIHLSYNDDFVRKSRLFNKAMDILEQAFHHNDGKAMMYSRRLLSFSVSLNFPINQVTSFASEYLSHFQSIDSAIVTHVSASLIDCLNYAIHETNEDKVTHRFSNAIAGMKQPAEGGNEARPGAGLTEPVSSEDIHCASLFTEHDAVNADTTLEHHTEKEAEATKSNVIFIDNAGVVLLSPFLPALFARLGFLNNARNRFVDTDSAVRAVHLLHFLATGTERPREYLLVFPKIMCDLPVELGVTRDLDLTREEKDECMELLRSAIRHWSILKNASPDGLRETFLMRSGKVELFSDTTRVMVEARSVDMLLDHLPWSISFVQFPWLRKAIAIEWCN